MAWDGSGNFIRTDGALTGSNICATQAATSVGIQASRFDNELNNIAGGLENCITIDGQNKPSSPFDFNSLKGINLGAGTTNTDAVTLAQLIGNGAIQLGSVTGTAPTYTATTSLPITSYGDGQTFCFNVGYSAAGNATININTLGAIAIQDVRGNNIAAGRLPYFCVVTYSTVNNAFVLASNLDQSIFKVCSTTAGTSTAYTTTSTEDLDSYYEGLTLRLVLHTTCGNSPTLNLNSIGAKPLITTKGIAYKSSDLRASKQLLCVFSATSDAFIVINGDNLYSSTWTPTVTGSGSMTVVDSGTTYRYVESEHFVDIFMLANLTISGTASNLIDFTLPSIGALPLMITPCAVDGGDNLGPFDATALVISSGPTGIVQFSKTSRANFALGTGAFIRIHGRYLKA